MKRAVTRYLVPAVAAVAAVAATGFIDQANALQGEDWWVGGRVRQGFSFNYDLPQKNGVEVGPSQFMTELQGEWTPHQSLTVIADFWFRGDLFYELNNGQTTQGGIQNLFAGPPFTTQFQHNLSREGSGALPQPFGENGSESQFLDDFNEDIIREISVRYADPDGRFALKVGKFQRGWGQADGLRLLDILNPQDLRQRSVFADTDEWRIPQWTAALDVNLSRMGLQAPFEAIGMKKPTFEFLFMPEVRHSEFVINNPTPSDRSSGGLFGFPFPQLIDPKSGFGLPLLGANLENREADTFNDFEMAARLKFEALDGEFTLNGFLGYQDLPVVTLAGSNLVVGNFINDEAAALAVVPLDQATTIGAVHAPGQFLDFLRGVAGVQALVPYPLIPFGCFDPTGITPPAPGSVPCSINANFNLDYNHQQKVVGGSFTRDMTELKFGPKDVSPVLRVEATYEFDKPFNRGVITTAFGEVETGTPALIGTDAQMITERDVVSLLLGVDYNIWFPFWEGQKSSLFATTQLFNIYTEDHEGLLWQAPYAFTDVEKVQQFVSQTWTLPLFDEFLTLDGLFLWDVDKGGVAYRQRIDLSFLGAQLKPRLEWVHIKGNREQGPLGALEDADYVEASVTYQF